MRPILLLGVAGIPLALLACQSSGGGPGGSSVEATPARAPISEPMRIDGKAYDSATQVELPVQKPEEFEGLHNVFHLSPNIVSGSEPHGDVALRQLRDMGIHTIISVDGKAPDAAEAEALGMRYVHIPIQYKGITDDELNRLAKSFRELEPPFYVHCFHGKHRGPAAAAVGRVALDGVSRETAIAEMRQYCGTSPKYEGLYKIIATGNIPEPAETEGYAFGFDPVQKLDGVAGLMVVISRAHDHVEELMALEWAVDSEHPDVDPLNEAIKMADAFDAACELGEVEMSAKSDYREWFATSREQSQKLVDALTRFRAGEPAAAAEATTTFKDLQKTCNACHTPYRN